MVNHHVSNPCPLQIETFCFNDYDNNTFYVDFHQQEIELPNTATNITIQVTTGLGSHATSISYRLPGVTNEESMADVRYYLLHQPAVPVLTTRNKR